MGRPEEHRSIREGIQHARQDKGDTGEYRYGMERREGREVKEGRGMGRRG